jgi:hypothetical protein
MFEDRQDTVLVKTAKIFLKMEMRRQPGYLFDARLLESADQASGKTGLAGVNIEVYNRTADKLETTLKLKSTAAFQQRFDQGNHYTVLIRKPGYIARRLDVYVNNGGCALCIDGISEFKKSENVQVIADNKVIPLSADIVMERAVVGKRLVFPGLNEEVLQEWGKNQSVNKEINQLLTLMKDNPDISFEIGFHTDSRGNDDYNLAQSEKLANLARNNFIGAGVEAGRISAKGYGETQLLNKCANDVECTEAEHQQNRRTELLVTAFSTESYQWLSMEQIVEEEKIAERSKSEQNTPPKIERPSFPKNKPQPEANNSVPLPEFKGDNKAGEDAYKSGAPSHSNDLAPRKNVNIRPLDGAFTGYAIQVYKTNEEMNALPKPLRSFTDIYWKQESDGISYYYILPQGALSEVRKYYRKTIKPEHPDALLVRFGAKGKVYMK